MIAGPVEDAVTAISKGDYATALPLLRALAEQGNGRAQYNLGFMYTNGHGVPRDFIRAYMWLSLAVAQDDQIAAEDRNRIERRMTPAQLAEALELAREWKPTPQLPR